ncbi:acyltransferase [Nonomuraea sp. C10]|uniref:acyltransferase family protein n=1 Tax=Nonomuraea sp. C10 TaxID=2600577 RepID=UPI00164EFFAC|nr:acyltransferase [Nonomuraea sp. C10]
MPPVPPASPTRRSELDSIRVLVVVGLVFFHAALVFDASDDFYVRNAETTGASIVVSALGVVWAMPILFLIAGFGAWHSLRRRGPAGFTAERLLRLGVPLVFGTLTIVPVPQWLRLRADPGYHESYLAFLPRFFEARFDLAEFPFVLQGEHFETGHLWFMLLLLVFALMLAAVARWFPAGRARAIGDRLAAVAAGRRGALLAAAVPVSLLSALAGLEQEYAGWSRWAYLLFFCYGFVLAADDRFRAAIRRDAPLAAAVGLALPVVGLPMFLLAGGDPFTDLTPMAAVARAMYGAAGWCLLVGILGLLDRRAAARPPATRPRGGARRRVYAYLAAGVLPLYVLHQPIVVAVAYGVVRLDAPIVVKYPLIVAASLVLTVAAYDLLVRRTRVTRFLFGMRDGR